MATKNVENEQNGEHSSEAVGEKGEREKMLKNGAEEKSSEKPKEKDAEIGAATKFDPPPIGSKKGEQIALISADDLEQYKTDPFWRGMRFAVFGLLALLFIGLVTLAILLVVLSPKCESPPSPAASIAMHQNQNQTNVPLVHPPHLIVPPGVEATFHCKYPAGVSVKWTKEEGGESEGELPPGMEQFDDGTLHIEKAEVAHQGKYFCQTTGEAKRRSESVRLEVLSPKQETYSYLVSEAPSTESTTATSPASSKATKPRVDSNLLVASAGDPVHFRCWQCQFSNCQTSHKLVWRKLHPIGHRQQMLVERDGQSAFLIFSAVAQGDAGTYECVDAESGVASSHVHLQVEPPRTPVIHPFEPSIPEGAPAILRCTVPGHSDAQLSWRLENGVEAGRLYGVRDHGEGTLQIGAVRPEHERHGFVCWALYPRRADKQALHTGPVKIRMIKKEEGPKEGPNEGPPTKPVQNNPTPQKPEEAANEGDAGEEDGEIGSILKKAPEMPEQPMAANNAEDAEGSGEAVIKIEPLLDYVSATATKLNESWGQGEAEGEEGSGEEMERRL